MSTRHSVSERAKRHPGASGIGRAALVVLLLACVVRPVAAQPEPDGRYRLGGLAVTPAISLYDIGLDSNVFNESAAPKSDFTMTLQPALDAAARIGAVRMAWSGRGDVSYYRRYSDQGTPAGRHRLQIDVPINRVRLFATHAYVNAKDRPTPEIDVRVRRREHLVTSGAEVHVSALTRATLTVESGLTEFDESASVRGLSIAAALDRQTDRVGASIAHALTPLTSLTGACVIQRERFLGDELRSNTNRRASAGLSFRPLALVTGRIEAGVLDYASRDHRVPGLQAPAFAADLGYVFKGRTHLALRGDRTISYSIDDASAYYLQTSYGVTVIHALTDTFQLTAGAGRQWLEHQQTSTAPPVGEPVAPLTKIAFVDTGIGYDMGAGVRWSLRASYVTRDPIGGAVATHFENLRVFAAISYGTGR